MLKKIFYKKRNMKKLFILFLLFSAAHIRSVAQVNAAKLDQLFETYDTHQKAMLSMCLSENKRVVYHKSIGYGDLGKQVKANEQTLYHIGSISKMFTAVMILQLIDEKKLSLTTKLDSFFTGIPNSDKITMSMMLNHRSGIHNFTDDSEYASYMEKPMKQEELLAIFEKQTSDFEPDSTASYSNTNYVLLSFIIEKITGNYYDIELQTRICEIAGLINTKVGTNLGGEAVSYEFAEGKWNPATVTDMSVPRGAGAIVSTPSDLCLFIEALFSGKLISATSFYEMKSIRDHYGLGIFAVPFNGKKGYGHTGGIDGFQSVLVYFPDDKLALCILGNGWNSVMNDLSIGVLSIYFKQEYTIPSFEKKSVGAEASKTLEGVYANGAIGMKITITNTDGKLSAQATGQSAFPLDKVSELEYKFDAANIKLTFFKDKDGDIPSLKLLQGGMNLSFEKE